MREAKPDRGVSGKELSSSEQEADGTAWAGLATTLMSKGRYHEAIDVLHVAIGKEPMAGRIWLLLGKAYLRVGQLEEARASLEIALRNHASADQVQRGLQRIDRAEVVRGCGHSGEAVSEISIAEADE